MGFSSRMLSLLLLSCVVSSAMAATCVAFTQNAINPADITNLAKDIAANNLSPPLDSPLGFTALTTHAVGLGTAQFCMQNEFAFESTHISLSDIQFAANDVVSQCCFGPTCQGGFFSIKGDTGITVRLTVQPIGDDCDV